MRGIEPNTGLNLFLKIALNVFCAYKTVFFSYILSFFIYFNTLQVIIGIKPAPGDHESNFKNVGSILFGFNTLRILEYKTIIVFILNLGLFLFFFILQLILSWRIILLNNRSLLFWIHKYYFNKCFSDPTQKNCDCIKGREDH